MYQVGKKELYLEHVELARHQHLHFSICIKYHNIPCDKFRKNRIRQLQNADICPFGRCNQGEGNRKENTCSCAGWAVRHKQTLSGIVCSVSVMLTDSTPPGLTQLSVPSQQYLMAEQPGAAIQEITGVTSRKMGGKGRRGRHEWLDFLEQTDWYLCGPRLPES